MKTGRDAVTEGSGNVFADLGLPHPEQRLAKARLAGRILDGIEARGWTQMQAASELGLSQPDVSRLGRGILKEFSLERLIRLLSKLDYSLSIHVRGGGLPAEEIGISR